MRFRPVSSPFGVHVRVEKRADERLERARGVLRRNRQRGLPSVDDDLAAAAVDGADEPVRIEDLGERLGARAVHAAIVEERRAEDDAPRAGGEQFLRAVDRSDAAADLTGQRRGHTADELVVGRPAHRRIQIDELHDREGRELLDPAVDVVGRDRQPLALLELDDTATHEIDRRNQHEKSYQSRRIGTPRSDRNIFRSRTACSEK